jgi:hypothetical protein
MPVPEPLRRPRPTIGIRAQGGISLGDLPDVGPLLRGALALQWWRPTGPGVRIELEGAYVFRRTLRLDEQPDRGADLRAALATLRGCPVWRHVPSELEFPLCFGIEAGALIGRGVGYPSVSEAALAWLALDVSLGVTWNPVPHFALGLTAEPLVPLLRSRFRVEGEGVLWQPLPVGFRALGGFEVRF